MDRETMPDGEAKIAFYRPTVKGRGAQLSPQVRFDAFSREEIDDGWSLPEERDEAVAGMGGAPSLPRTTVTAQPAKSIISRNQSPDLPFNQSVNPYYGCEHGCAYCYARPSYAYWGLSPGLDFETRIFAKPNAAELLMAALARPGYVCETLAIGTNTDAYQPAEREWKITRGLLEVCADFNQPVALITKSSLVERDIDILGHMAAKGLAKVYISVPTTDAETARLLEPRAAAPYRRIETIRALAGAGIPVGVMTAPVIPMVNDSGMEAALEAARAAGATEAAYVLLRLAHELKDIFRDWLDRHMPMRAAHVMSVIQQMRGGEDNDSRFGVRMKGEGIFAELIAQRFAKACARLGLNERHYDLDASRFRVPERALPKPRKARVVEDGPQLALF
jgi:DNA repair photolyase